MGMTKKGKTGWRQHGTDWNPQPSAALSPSPSWAAGMCLPSGLAGESSRRRCQSPGERLFPFQSRCVQTHADRCAEHWLAFRQKPILGLIIRSKCKSSPPGSWWFISRVLGKKIIYILSCSLTFLFILYTCWQISKKTFHGDFFFYICFFIFLPPPRPQHWSCYIQPLLANSNVDIILSHLPFASYGFQQGLVCNYYREHRDNFVLPVPLHYWSWEYNH